MSITTQGHINHPVAIVTGGSRGIGRCIAESLAAEHYQVIISYQNGTPNAEAAVARIREAAGKAIAVSADIADEAAVTMLFDTAEKAFGGVDVVVHAAAVLTAKPLTELTITEIDSMITTNLRGSLLVNRQAAKKIRPGGSLINLSSAVTNNHAAGYSVYTATKAGLEAVTKVLARELGNQGITVNAIAPGPTETEMFKSDLENSPNGEQMRQAIIGMTPLGRIGKPDDIADVVLALAAKMRWVTGQVIHVSGGIAI